MELFIKPPWRELYRDHRGFDAEKVLRALYTYTHTFFLFFSADAGGFMNPALIVLGVRVNFKNKLLGIE